MTTLKSQLLNSECFEKAQDDEPVFLLLGRDVDAQMAIRAWIYSRVITRGLNDKSNRDILDAVGDLDAFKKYQTEIKPVDIDTNSILLGVIQKALEDLIGLNSLAAEGRRLQEDTIKNAKRALHRLLIEQEAIIQGRPLT